MKAHKVTEGDVINLAGPWVVTDVSGYSDGDVIIYANGPRPNLTAVFTMRASFDVKVEDE